MREKIGNTLAVTGLTVLVGLGATACGSSGSSGTNGPHKLSKQESTKLPNVQVAYNHGWRIVSYGGINDSGILGSRDQEKYTLDDEYDYCDGHTLVIKTPTHIDRSITTSGTTQHIPKAPECDDLTLTPSDFPVTPGVDH
jgi:hypothetical protein